jgi:hypothetical protein
MAEYGVFQGFENAHRYLSVLVRRRALFTCMQYAPEVLNKL